MFKKPRSHRQVAAGLSHFSSEMKTVRPVGAAHNAALPGLSSREVKACDGREGHIVKSPVTLRVRLMKRMLQVALRRQ